MATRDPNPGGGGRVRSVQLPALAAGFFLIWGPDELRHQIQLSIHALFF